MIYMPTSVLGEYTSQDPAYSCPTLLTYSTLAAKRILQGFAISQSCATSQSNTLLIVATEGYRSTTASTTSIPMQQVGLVFPIFVLRLAS